MKIGPVSARFKGNLKLTNVNPPTGYTINFDGQGGVAGFGRGSADVSLTPLERELDEARLPRARDRRRQDGADRLAPDRRHRRQDHRRLLQGVRGAAAGARAGGRRPRRRRARARASRASPPATLGWVLAAIVVAAPLFLIAR